MAARNKIITVSGTSRRRGFDQPLAGSEFAMRDFPNKHKNETSQNPEYTVCRIKDKRVIGGFNYHFNEINWPYNFGFWPTPAHRTVENHAWGIAAY